MPTHGLIVSLITMALIFLGCQDQQVAAAESVDSEDELTLSETAEKPMARDSMHDNTPELSGGDASPHADLEQGARDPLFGTDVDVNGGEEGRDRGESDPLVMEESGGGIIMPRDVGTELASGGHSEGGHTEDVTRVDTTEGPIQGYWADGVDHFLGIPYAQPPLGNNRFKPPTSALRRRGVLQTRRVGSPCPQVRSDGRIIGQEDCLTLNVWAPRQGERIHNKPVMVWLHGGAFVLGSGGLELYDGKKLAQVGDVVVVTLNYRLGVLGFLAHPSLALEDLEHGVSGNYGLLDQQLALRWVKTNIRRFGGDPNNITIFGESAGAVSIIYHLISRWSSDGLFHKAIIQSGNLMTRTSQLSTGQLGQQFVLEMGCALSTNIPACLRRLPVQQVVDSQAGRGLLGTTTLWLPHIDGHWLPADPVSRIAAGDFASVPTLLGTTVDEGSLFMQDEVARIDSVAEFEAYVWRVWTPYAPELLGEAFNDAIYAPGAFPTPFLAAAAIYGDVVYRCPTRRLARLLHGAGTPTFRYLFAQEYGDDALGVYHASELAFVFDSQPFLGADEIAVAHRPLVSHIQEAWSHFAHHGRPRPNLAEWPPYDGSNNAYRLETNRLGIGLDDSSVRCDYWDPRVAAFDRVY